MKATHGTEPAINQPDTYRDARRAEAAAVLLSERLTLSYGVVDQQVCPHLLADPSRSLLRSTTPKPRWWVFSSSSAVSVSHRGGYSAGSSAAGARSVGDRGDQPAALLIARAAWIVQ
jgi:hypothetical protein